MLARVVCVLYCIIFSTQLLAADDEVAVLYGQWQNSQIFTNQSLDKSQLLVFVKKAQTLVKQQPDNPQACALSGMIKAFYASQISNLDGLKMAKQARDELQHALRLDPTVFHGEAYAELGLLYHNTPGWPFSFGSQKMAERLLTKALEMDPDGLMTNLRFGQYWFEQKDYVQARKCLQFAISAVNEDTQLTWVDFQLVQAKHMLAKINK